MEPNTFDVIERRRRITVFKLGNLWVFKQFFDKIKHRWRFAKNLLNHTRSN